MRSRRVASRWVWVPFFVLGLFVLLASLGVIPLVSTGRRRGLLDGIRHWQVTSLGICFLAASVASALSGGNRVLKSTLAFIATSSLIAPLTWLIFASKLPLQERVLLGIVVGGTALGALAIVVHKTRNRCASGAPRRRIAATQLKRPI